MNTNSAVTDVPGQEKPGSVFVINHDDRHRSSLTKSAPLLLHGNRVVSDSGGGNSLRYVEQKRRGLMLLGFDIPDDHVVTIRPATRRDDAAFPVIMPCNALTQLPVQIREPGFPVPSGIVRSGHKQATNR